MTALLATPRSPRYLSLDHWRGIACLLVVLFHSASVWALGSPAIQRESGVVDQAAAAVLGLLRFGWVGVPIFFVISGYAISATADSSRRKDGGVRGYAWRRFRRIYPPYWAMLGLSVVLMLILDVLLFPGLLSGSVAPIGRPWTLTPDQWLGNLTLTESWLFHLPLIGERAYVLGQAWTLCYEEQFYLVMGAVILAVPRRFFAATTAVTLFVLATPFIAGRLHIHVNGLFIDGYWLIFAAGILVYRQVNYGDRRSAVLTWALLGLGLLYGLRHLPRTTTLDQFMIVGFLFAGLVLALHPFDRRIATTRSFEPIRFLGTICFSLYLSHAIIVRAVSTLFWNAGVTSSIATMLVVVPICTALAIVVGTLFHRLVERHFMSSPQPAPQPVMTAVQA